MGIIKRFCALLIFLIISCGKEKQHKNKREKKVYSKFFYHDGKINNTKLPDSIFYYNDFYNKELSIIYALRNKEDSLYYGKHFDENNRIIEEGNYKRFGEGKWMPQGWITKIGRDKKEMFEFISIKEGNNIVYIPNQFKEYQDGKLVDGDYIDIEIADTVFVNQEVKFKLTYYPSVNKNDSMTPLIILGADKNKYDEMDHYFSNLENIKLDTFRFSKGNNDFVEFYMKFKEVGNQHFRGIVYTTHIEKENIENEKDSMIVSFINSNLYFDKKIYVKEEL